VEVLSDIPLDLDAGSLMDSLNMGRQNHSMAQLLDELVDIVRPIARPKALYRVSYIDQKTETGVSIDGVEFHSRILRRNLEQVERVFPYIVTAGRELESIPVAGGDMVRAFCLDVIKERILEQALVHLEHHIQRRFKPGTLAHMNPGSLKEWPISQQPALFSLFGDVEALVGVRLTDSFLMDPIKSVSGIHFPTEIDFKSCKLCTRHPCVKRRAPYDPAMALEFRKG